MKENSFDNPYGTQEKKTWQYSSFQFPSYKCDETSHTFGKYVKPGPSCILLLQKPTIIIWAFNNTGPLQPQALQSATTSIRWHKQHSAIMLSKTAIEWWSV